MPEPRPNAAADRNLLFGILALQADLISRDALIGAMSAWAVNKATPLGQILRDQGALDADGHALVEALVRRSLDRHQGSAEQSLAALSSLGSARQDLERIADADLHASLAHVAAAPPADGATTVGRPTSSGLRFRVLRPHARGGLGEVFVAHDEELHREVALKEIQEKHADQPDSRARFLLEAEITGGLEHPGIVPVYGLGSYADGRPFYAMRFVRGDSLKDAIEHFHRADGPEREPGERALALRGLLRRFIDVCNAIAYAHARGVLHRDLKPGNAMLGRYGETLVVDWGLAKAVGRKEGDPGSEEGTLRPTAASDSAPTQLGSALGTPAYMSPEQAAGRWDLLGPASPDLALDPKFAQAHSNLGLALFAQGERAEAVKEFRRALELDPKLPSAHGALGQALLLQGRFREARDSTRRCLQLLPRGHPQRPLGSQQLRQCERLLVLDARLPALLQGKAQAASAAERLEYADLCQRKQLSSAAARFSAEAFAADPKLADNLLTGHRYNATCSAALAGNGQGQDASQLGAPERARLRQQAVAWLRADLARWAKVLETGIPQARAAVRHKLRHWQNDPDLAGIRDEAGLAWLPAGEQEACRRLWADVAALLHRAGSPK
jgi:tetratricopeptide (TPR) repeat protein